MLFTHDAYYYGQLVQSGAVSSRELTQASLENIERLNPILNAVVSVYQDAALEQAGRLDQQLSQYTASQRRQLSPFYGLPLLLKDIGQYWQGTVTAAGSALLVDQPAQHTDRSIELASQAGMVFIGRSNIPEFGLKTVSDSKYFKPVKNPVNLAYNPGGSSGGAAAAVKSGMVPLATGSDAGGSIRVPASDTGLIGLKPSRGRIAEGPGFYRPVFGLATNLLMAKSTQDTFYYLRELQSDQVTAMNRLPEIPLVELAELDRPLRIAYSRQHPRGGSNAPQAHAALDQTLELLRGLGHELVEVDFPVDGNRVLEAYYQIMSLETGKIIYQLAVQGRQVDFDAVDPLTWVTYQFAPEVTGFMVSDFNEFQDALVETMELFYQDYDLWLTPATSAPAVRNEDLVYPATLLSEIQSMGTLDATSKWEVTKAAFNFTYWRTSYSQLMNITGQPAISLPLYEDEQGLPLGSQFATKRGGEYVLLQLSQQLERAGHLKTDIVAVTDFGD